MPGYSGVGEVTLPPVPLDDGELTMRSPRLRDAAAWSAARLANRSWLERAFPAWGGDWAKEQSPEAWVRRWRHLQALRRDGLAFPFVMLLNGRLIGELGVDAIDEATGLGEASVWMVRDHGSSAVMYAASLMLIDHAFGDTVTGRPLDRMLSPVATSSRKGRAPGLQAVGFDIEATVLRPVGDADAVDHDLWIVPNNPETRAATATALARLRAGRPGEPQSVAPGDRSAASSAAVTGADARAVSRGVAGALARGAVDRVRQARNRRAQAPPPARPSTRTGPRAAVTVDDIGVVRREGRVVGRLDIRTDRGTATVTVRPLPEDTLRREEAVLDLAAGVCLLADDPARRAPYVRWLDVALDPGVEHMATPLAVAGFTHIATLRPNPDGPRGFAGEQWWRRAVGPADPVT